MGSAGVWMVLSVKLGLCQNVVINKVYNDGSAASGDMVELLITADHTDLRGLFIKDFSGNNGTDGGRYFQFANVSLWNELHAGTLIVLRNNATSNDVVTSCTDFVLDVGLLNPGYFTAQTGSVFDISVNDMVMIKSTSGAGISNNIHTFKIGTNGALWNAINSGVVNGSSTAGASATSSCVTNSNSKLSDFSSGFATNVAGGITNLAGSSLFGLANTTGNSNFITFLRGPLSVTTSAVTSIGFDVNWNSLVLANSYLIDIDDNSDFSSPLVAYTALNVGNVNHVTINNNVNPGTTYYIRVRAINLSLTQSGNSCTQTVTTNPCTIPQINLIGQQPVSCYGDSNGAIHISLSNGSASWSNGALGTDLIHLHAGTYTVTVTDATCVNSASYTIVQPDSLYVTTSPTVSVCEGNSVFIVCTPSGGTLPYNSYQWTGPNAFTSSVQNPILTGCTSASAGTYTVTITDHNNCTTTAQLVVSVQPIQPTDTFVNACNSFTWPQSGLTYTSSGLYTSNYNCEQHSLHLFINHPVFDTQFVAARSCYFWLLNGTTYSVTGIYTFDAVNGMSNCIDHHALILSITQGIQLHARAFLDGPYQISSGLMKDSLRSKGLLPLIEPYSSLPYNKLVTPNEPAGESTTPIILSQTGQDAIIDWVYLELRSSLNPAMVVATKRALLQRDGDVVSHEDGISPVFFMNVNPGNYYISIKHRNHLGVMSAAPVSFVNCQTSYFDFSQDSVYTNQSILNSPRKKSGSIYLLWSADANGNKNCKYNGLSNDKEALLMTLGFSTPNNTLSSVYRQDDLNMDGVVRYNNLENDRLVILSNTGVNTPNTTICQHTPN